MRRGRAALIIVIIELIVLHHVVALLVTNLALVLLFWTVARTHPRDRCRTCHGGGRFYHRIFAWRFRLCANCGGNGRVISWSAARFGSPSVRELATTEKLAREKRRARTGTFGFPEHR
jgi:hypothetical protein